MTTPPPIKLIKIAPKHLVMMTPETADAGSHQAGSFVRIRDEKLKDKRQYELAKGQLERLQSVTHNTGIRLAGDLKSLKKTPAPRKSRRKGQTTHQPSGMFTSSVFNTVKD